MRGEGGAAFLQRSTGFDGIVSLQQALEHAYAQAADCIDTAVGPEAEMKDENDDETLS